MEGLPAACLGCLSYGVCVCTYVQVHECIGIHTTPKNGSNELASKLVGKRGDRESLLGMAVELVLDQGMRQPHEIHASLRVCMCALHAERRAVAPSRFNYALRGHLF